MSDKDALTIAEGLALPLELAARTQVILAMKGAGKTYAAMRETEELLAAGQQVVALDPTGVWWGLRSPRSAHSGRSFEIIVLGGEHGDAPLEPTAGAVVARFVCESRRSVVLDMSAFESNGAQDRFATDFAETLYRLKAKDRGTMHLMVDEADSFAPQRPMPAQMRMLGAFEAIVRRGRSRGLGITLISQRPAVLNKNVMSQADLLVCLRVVGAHDHKALSEWAKLYAEPGQMEAFMESLPRLGVGEAWFWSPGWLKIFQRAKVLPRFSFDSSSTPEPGTVRAAVKMRPVDIDALSEEIRASIEQAQVNDPRKLRAEVARLERELASAQSAPAAVKVETREVWALTDEDRALLLDLTERGGEWIERLAQLVKDASRVCAPAPRAADNARPAVAVPTRTTRAAAPSAPVAYADGAAKLGKAERSILTVLKQYAPAAVAKKRVALIAGYSMGGGGFNNPLGALRTRGLIEGSDPMRITEAGAAAIGTVPELPSGPDLLRYWQGQLGKAERLILGALAEAPGGRLSKQALADATGYEASGGGFNNPLGKLRTLQLISGSGELQLAEELQ